MFVSIFGFLIKPINCIGEEWLTGWDYRKSHLITSAIGSGNSFQIKINVYYDNGTDLNDDVYLGGKCQSDFDDIRFTDDDGETLLYYWLESKIDDDNAVFWVKINDSLSVNNVTIYIYYGNILADSISDGDLTFLFFDDFNDGSLDSNKWISSGTINEVGGEIIITNAGYITSKTIFGLSTKTIMKTKSSASGARLCQIGTTPYSDYLNLVYYTVISASYFAGTSYDAPNSDTWISDVTLGTDYHIWEIRRINESLALFYIDNILKHTSNIDNQIPDGDLEIEISRFLNGVSTGDYLFEAKSCYPEPLNSLWGNEETAPSPIEYDAEEGDMLIMAFILIVVLFGGLFLIIITKQKTSD